jgi:hypothetical protein
MANIPSHMKIRSDLAMTPRPSRSSMSLLISIGVAIGLASAGIAMLSGVIG